MLWLVLLVLAVIVLAITLIGIPLAVLFAIGAAGFGAVLRDLRARRR